MESEQLNSEAAVQDLVSISNEESKELNLDAVQDSKIECDSNSSATEDIPITEFDIPQESKEPVEESKSETENTSEIEQKVPQKRPGRKRRVPIYNDNDDPETIKEKKKKRAVELKLRHLRCTFTDNNAVTGKRQKKPPQRFELQPAEKRKSSVDDGNGSGEFLGDIRWINHQLRAASLNTLRALHRLIYRKQGMFAEKQIIKSVMKFNGYPFDKNHPELQRRKDQCERYTDTCLQTLSMLLGLRPGTHEEMVDRIINFLLCPSQKEIQAYIQEVMDSKLHLHQSKQYVQKALFETTFQGALSEENSENPLFPEFPLSRTKVDFDAEWKKPAFFTDGDGVKLKLIPAITTNVEVASDAFVELMHRLLFLNIDDKLNMRRNILEFSGFKCEVGTSDYIYRVRILSVLPMDQLKLICRVLCLPTWHRSRQFLTDSIMDFLTIPRLSVMKKRVPPLVNTDISFSQEGTKFNQNKLLEQLETSETEEIEIVPDIPDYDSISLTSSETEEIEIVPDIPDYSSPPGHDPHLDGEYLGVMLKNFSNIHYQVISTPAIKLTDVHMILYLSPSTQNNIRKRILEFSGFPFDEMSVEYKCRRRLMEQMSVKCLKTVATVLCVSQYVCDESKHSLIEAILKFLQKPGALLSSSTALPTILPSPPSSKPKPSVVKKKATSTCTPAKSSDDVEVIPVISSVWSESEKEVVSEKSLTLDKPISREEDAVQEIEKVKACFPNAAIEITPIPAKPETVTTVSKPEIVTTVSKPEIVLLPKPNPDNCAIMIKKEMEMIPTEVDETLSFIRREGLKASPEPQNLPCVKYFASDDEEDQPLSKMIGHPNDDQLRSLISNIMKKSKLDEITMKHVIQQVFDTYPNYDLNYRREFIKSNVRLILSQMGDQNCSVSTTVVSV